MTTQTDAQIVALADHLCRLFFDSRLDYFPNVVPTFSGQRTKRDMLQIAKDILNKFALTAAAEIGKPSSYEAARATYGDPYVDVIVKNAIAATIERCAQVMDELAAEPSQPAIKASAYEAGAAAIRALKDKA